MTTLFFVYLHLLRAFLIDAMEHEKAARINYSIRREFNK